MLIIDPLHRMQRPRSTLQNITYSYIDWIRMVAIFAIVLVHNVLFPEAPPTIPIQELHHYPIYQHLTSGQATAMLIFGQFVRFGTLLFFAVSGFLLGKKLENGSSWAYYKRRLRTILIPFLIAFGLYVGKSVGFNWLTHHADSANGLLALIVLKVTYTFLNTPFWFVPNYFLSLAILLLLRRYLLRPWFAGLMIAITVAYGLNTHQNWTESRHNYAVLGFVFWLWFGYVIAKTNAVERSRQYLPTAVLFLLTGMCYGAALAEGFWLNNQSTPDPLNSLRLTNQLFAICLFFLLTRLNGLPALPFLNPRCESFGIYLYHMFFVLALSRLHEVVPIVDCIGYQPTYSGATLVSLTLLRGLFTYALTLLFVKWIANTRFAWLVGAQPR